jgi:hypothetical protein
VLDVRIELRSASATPPRCAACVYFRVRWLHTPRIAMIRKKIESQSRDATAESYRACVRDARVRVHRTADGSRTLSSPSQDA